MMDDWHGKHYAFFQNRECECFPCHPTEHPEDFNCLFCYCPLYPLGEQCRGSCRYTDSGIKDCSQCAFPHMRESYGVITERFREVAAIAARKDGK